MPADHATSADDRSSGSARSLAARFRGWPWPVRVVLRLAGLLVIGWTMLVGTLWFMQDTLIFPRHMTPPPGRDVPLDIEEIWHRAADGSNVPAWLLMPPDAPRNSRSPVALFWHGNGEIIDHLRHDPVVTLLTSLGVGVLMVEYRGYGRADGEPSQAALTEDGAAFVELLRARNDVDPARIALIGRSLGGGAACAVAERMGDRPPAGVALISSFTSIASMARAYLVPTVLVRHPFHNDRVVPGLVDRGVPVLLMHGTRDRVVPAWHSRRLHEMAPGSVLVEQDADHNDFPSDREGFDRALKAWLVRAGMVDPSRE